MPKFLKTFRFTFNTCLVVIASPAESVSQTALLKAAEIGSEEVDLCLTATPDGGGPEAFQVDVLVEMGLSKVPICGVQFFLKYDVNALEFLSITPTDPDLGTVLLEAIDQVAGTIDFFIGANPGAICFGITGPTTLAVVSFTATPACTNTGVCFRGHNPPTRLGGVDGTEVCPVGHRRPDGTCGLINNPDAAPCCTGNLNVECIENPELCLNITPDGPCSAASGDSIIVSVDMGFSTEPICGAQFFLEYDTSALEFKSITPGGGVFNTVLFELVDTVSGTIDYIVGDDPGAICTGTQSPATVATILFNILGDCKIDTLCFRPHNPPTRLGGADGSEICPLGHLRPDGSCGLLNNPLADPCCPGTLKLDRDGPIFKNCPSFKAFGNADCGEVSRTVTWDKIAANDKCDGAVPVDCMITHNLGADVSKLLNGGGAFPPGVTSVWCTSTDACGHTSECHFDIGNSGLNGLHVEIELSPTMDSGPFLRGIELSITDCGVIANPSPPVVLGNGVFGFPFNVPGHGTINVKVPPGNYVCVEARDPLHTLDAACTVTCEDIPQKGSTWFASFKGAKSLQTECHWLANGNLNGIDGDGVARIDVLDFVTYLSCVANNPTPGASTPAGTSAPHCDINGDGIVNLLDFSFILVNLFNTDKVGCEAVCGGPAPVGPVAGPLESITLRELAEMGLGREGRMADIDNNGVVDLTDMALYLNNGGISATTSNDVARDAGRDTKGDRSARGLR